MNKKILALAIGAGVLVYLVTRNKNVAGTSASTTGLPQAQPSTNPTTSTTSNSGIVPGYQANANPFESVGTLVREPESGATVLPATASSTPLKIGDIAKAGPNGATAYVTGQKGSGGWMSTGLEKGMFAPGATLGKIIANTMKNDGFVIQVADGTYSHFAYADIVKQN